MSEPRHHAFHAVAFAENFPLRELAASYPEAKRTLRDLRYPGGGGDVFLYPFGAVVFRDVDAGVREAELARLRRVHPSLTAEVVHEELTVRADPGERPGMKEGVLCIDELTPARAGLVALTVAQSAAMEYYERLVAAMFDRAAVLVGRLERTGTVSLRTGPLHRFIGEAVAARAEVITVLSLLDKPDEIWDDPTMDRIYADLRSEFDLVDRYTTLELKHRNVQETLELVLGVARDRRLVLLEAAIVLLITYEIVVPLLRAW